MRLRSVCVYCLDGSELTAECLSCSLQLQTVCPAQSTWITSAGIETDSISYALLRRATDANIHHIYGMTCMLNMRVFRPRPRLLFVDSMCGGLGLVDCVCVMWCLREQIQTEFLAIGTHTTKYACFSVS